MAVHLMDQARKAINKRLMVTLEKLPGCTSQVGESENYLLTTPQICFSWKSSRKKAILKKKSENSLLKFSEPNRHVEDGVLVSET